MNQRTQHGLSDFARTITRKRAGLAGLVFIACASWPRLALAQSRSELEVEFTARARASPGIGIERVALVEVAWTPASQSARRDVASNAAISHGSNGDTPTLVDFDPELEAAPGTEVPLDPLERDELDDDMSRRRLRDVKTKKTEDHRAIPFILTSGFVRRAIDAALSAQGVDRAFERLDGIARRARTSALLPDARLRVGRNRDESMRLTPTNDEPYRYSQAGGLSFLIEGAVTWRLGRLLFASEELSVERLRLARAREEQRVTHVALVELLAWQTAWRRVEAAEGRPTPALADLAEATLRLDVLTNGWFSAHQPELLPPLVHDGTTRRSFPESTAPKVEPPGKPPLPEEKGRLAPRAESRNARRIGPT